MSMMPFSKKSCKWLLAAAQMAVTLLLINLAQWEEYRHAVWLEQATGHRPREVDLAYIPSATLINLLISGPASQITTGTQYGEKIVLPRVALTCVFAFWLWIGWLLELGNIVPPRRWTATVRGVLHGVAAVLVSLIAAPKIARVFNWPGLYGGELWRVLKAYGISAAPVAEVLNLVWVSTIVVLLVIQTRRELKSGLAL